MIWAASLLGAVALVWCFGYLYWHHRISRGLSEIRAEASELIKNEMGFQSRLAPAGSRAIPRLIRELEDAVARNDRAAAIVIHWEIAEAISVAQDPGPGVSTAGPSRLGSDSDMDFVREMPAEARLWWDSNRAEYPAGWMWWSGKRRRP